jgi:ABC-type Fe3+-siderophore transport system permease subunit
MLSALVGLVFAIFLAIFAFRNHETAIGVAVAVIGILHALYRIRRGG